MKYSFSGECVHVIGAGSDIGEATHRLRAAYPLAVVVGCASGRRSRPCQ